MNWLKLLYSHSRLEGLLKLDNPALDKRLHPSNPAYLMKEWMYFETSPTLHRKIK